MGIMVIFEPNMARLISLMEKTTHEVPELILYVRYLFCNTACSCSLMVETKYTLIPE
jgi:hypothetical protein